MTLEPSIRSLILPVRIAVIARYLGQLAIVLAVLASVPTLVAAMLGEFALALALLTAVILPTGLLALGALQPAPRGGIQANEAMVVTALIFILAAALMTGPFTVAGMAPLDALFEAVSGITTTGLTTVTAVRDLSPGSLFLRAWLQFAGGLGFVVLAVALIGAQGAESRRLLDPAGAEEDLAVSTRVHARRMMAVYTLLTLTGIALLWATGLTPFTALLHGLSSVSTGGFSSFDNSLGAAPAGARFAAGLLSLAAAMPLVLYYRAISRRHAPEALRDPELLALLFMLAVVAAALHLSDALSPADALLQALNAQTTTGFSTVDAASLSNTGKAALILSMLSGAGLGSTGGGIKLLRLLILLRLVQILVWRSLLPPHAAITQRVAGLTLDDAQISRVIGVVLLYLLVVVASWLVFLAAGQDPLNALFEVVSATATVGLSSGLTATDLAPGLKLLLCFDMLAGRLEILALVVTLYPRTWIRRGD